MTTRNAPFGTYDTPLVRARIIGGRTVYVSDEQYTPRSPKDPSESLEKPYVGVSSNSPVLPPIPRNIPSPGGYASALKDKSNSHLHASDPPSDSNKGLNRHKIIPPISAPTKYNGQSDGSYGNDPGIVHKLLDKYTTRETYLPPRSIVLEKDEELLLRNKVHDDLVSFDMKKLRDVYVELTGFDRNLSGYITFQDLSFTLVKAKVNIAVDTLRLISCLFVSEVERGKVNYEKVLSFLASSRQRSSRERPPVTGRQSTHKSGHSTASKEDSISSPKYHRGAGIQAQENAKLLRLMQLQLADAGGNLNLESINRAFREADREHRGTLSKEQIKDISYKCRIPLQESLINQIIDRFKDINGQYQWEKYVLLLEKVVPTTTGLPMPDSKRPLEYAKQYPQPSDNWPKTQNSSNSPRTGVIRNTPPPTWAQTGEFPALPTSPSYRSPKKTDPNVNLAYGSPQAEKLSQKKKIVESQTEVERLEKELQKLKKEYESTKKQAGQGKKPDDIMPWFDRFMKLANALYSNDASNSGYLTKEEVQWLSNQYNHSYSLKIPEKEIAASLQRCSHQNKVALDPYLKMLSMQGP